MVNATVSQILNEVDNEYFTLYAEWLDSELKIMLLKADTVPLSGEMNADTVNYFSEELSKSSDDYIQETKEALCGKNDNIKFSIRDTTFEWKQNNIWTLGKIALSRVTDIRIISETFKRLLDCHQTIQEKLITLEKENKCLQELKVKLTTQIEEMIKIRISTENDLYKKFILILNAKKRRIRELENTIKDQNYEKDSVFDACTDQSEQEEEEEQEEKSDKSNDIETKSTDAVKRKLMDKHNGEYTCKTRKTDNVITNIDRNEQVSPMPSTSKIPLAETESISKNNSVSNTDTIPDKEQATNQKIKHLSNINFLEEESEDELFSQ